MMLTHIRGETAGASPAARQQRPTKAAAQGRQAGTRREHQGQPPLQTHQACCKHRIQTYQCVLHISSTKD